MGHIRCLHASSSPYNFWLAVSFFGLSCVTKTLGPGLRTATLALKGLHEFSNAPATDPIPSVSFFCEPTVRHGGAL